jgi:ribonuclease J
VIVTTISSHVHRLQQLFDVAARCGRRVEVIGRSLISTVELAERHGYLKRSLKHDTLGRTLILVTGSQGEDRAALARISRDENRNLNIQDGDVVVFSARTIPGNEASVAHVIDGLYRRGATVVDGKVGALVHVSGHAAQNDLRLMIRLVRPKFFIPVHGTVRHMVEHARLAAECGVDAAKTLVALNGDVVEIDGETIRKTGTVAAGKQFVAHTVGAVADAVLFDRLSLADAGFVVVMIALSEGRSAQPSVVVTRGLLHVDQNREFLAEVSGAVDTLVDYLSEQGADFDTIRAEVRAEIVRKLAPTQGRDPIIIPFLLEM